MLKPTLYTIAKTLDESPYPLFTTPYSVNLGGIRNVQELQSNKFNDFLYAFYTDLSGQLIGYVAKATTDPGLYWRENLINVNGTAILKKGHYKSCYQLKENGHKGYKAFRQVQEMEYYRDSNRDSDLNLIGETYKENALTNIHAAGIASLNVDKWSAGCQVVGSRHDWLRILYIADQQANNGLGNQFSYTLFDSSEIKT